MPPRDGRAAETVDKVGGAAVVVSRALLEAGVSTREPYGNEPPERGVGGERVVPELLHRDRQVRWHSASHREICS